MAATTLKNYEVDGLMASFHQVRQATMSAIGRKLTPQHYHERDHECPICLTGIIEGESVMSCEQGCKQPIHLSCMSAYAESLRRTRSNVCCPLCRHPWADTASSAPSPARLAAAPTPTTTSPGASPASVRRLLAPVTVDGADAALPDTPSLPAEDLRRLRHWVLVFGERLVSCLHSSAWGARERALRKVHSLLTSDLAKPDSPPYHDASTIDVTTEVLARSSRDPVFKVYDAALAVLCALTGPRGAMGDLRHSISPILEVVLTKCGDAGRRMSERSIACVVELVVRGVVNFTFIMDLVLTTVHHTSMYQLDGLSTTNGHPANTDAATGATWRWWLGRLTILDRLMSMYTDRFIAEARAHLHRGSVGTELASNPLQLSRKWCQPALKHSHLKVKEAARRLLRRVSQLDAAAQLPPPSPTGPAEAPSCDLFAGVDCGAPNTALLDHDKSLQEATAMAQALSLAEAEGACPRVSSTEEDGSSRVEEAPVLSGPGGDPALAEQLQAEEDSGFAPSCISHLAPPSGSTAKSSSSCCGCSRKGRACIDPNEIPTACLRRKPDQLSLQLSIGTDYREGSHWEKGCLLGTGASASVFAARDVATQAALTVKQVSFFRNTHEGEQKVLRDVTREIDVMRRIDPHPNVVEYYGAVVDGHHCNLFMQHMEGGSVADHLAKAGPLDVDHVADFARQILQGLRYLHCHGVLHRDLKGANVLLDGAKETLRLCDFGTAAMLGNIKTQTGEFKSTHGTAAFMAPEVIRGASYGRAADIWSLGCLVIEMASGRQPWSEESFENPFALLFRVATSEDLPRIPECLGKAGEKFVRRCLSRDVAQRPTAADLLNDEFFQQAAQRREIARREAAAEAARAAKAASRAATAAAKKEAHDIASAAAAVALSIRAAAVKGAEGRQVEETAAVPSPPRTPPRHVPATRIARPVSRDSARQVGKRLFSHRRSASYDSGARQRKLPVSLAGEIKSSAGRPAAGGVCASQAAPATPKQRRRSPNSPERTRTTSSRFATAPCTACQLPVYVREKVMEEGRSFHKQCFKCTKCNSRLNLSSYAKAPDGLLYCAPHYRQLFKVRGNYKF